jgi:hypothetical protein
MGTQLFGGGSIGMKFRKREEALTKKPAQVPAAPFIHGTGEAPSTFENSQVIPASQPGAVGHQFGALSVQSPQTQVTVSQPADHAEREAERVADQVTRGTESVAVSGDPVRHASHVPLDESQSRESPADAESLTRAALGGGGAPLSGGTRREMEPLFGHDFSQVRIHTDGAASHSARAVNANAYTVGTDVVFGAGRYAPGTREGDRLLAHELTHVVQNTSAGLTNQSASGALALSRDPEVAVPPPKASDAPAEREKEAAFPEADKERARATVIAPLRASAARLGAGEKADVVSVIRHLKPMRAAAAGVKWPESALETVGDRMDEVSTVRTLLESLKLSDRQAVSGARRDWADARRELAAAVKALRAARDDKKAPETNAREGLSEDTNAVIALSAQIDATIQDLVKSPRTQEGFSAVADTAAELLPQFDTIKPPEAVSEVARAKDSITRGIATIAPLALGKEESLKVAQKSLSSVADRLAGLVGDAPPPPAPEAGEPGKDDEEPKEPVPTPTPAPSPNPLPPPPPPPLQVPPGTK